jgi:CheY-like chemotaxis protein
VVPEHTLSQDPVDLNGVQLLVVDDNRDSRELLQYALEQFGATVESAGSAHEAIQAVSQRTYHVLLADIGMPERDGYELIAAIRQLPQPHAVAMRAVAVTAYAGDHHRARAIAAGYDDYTTKPVEPAELARMVLALLPRQPEAA